MTIEDEYHKDFGKEEYDKALIILWEEHCKYNKQWPPTLEEVKKQIQSQNSGYDNERR